MKETNAASHCVLALAYGKQIKALNNIDGHLQFRKTLITTLAHREIGTYEAIVPIPHAAIYLGECWKAIRKEKLWLAFGSESYKKSMFSISDQREREMLAQKKVGSIRKKSSVKSSVIIIDEAVLSGTTMYHAIITLRKYGIKNVHVRTLMPPVFRRCPYGVIDYQPGSGYNRHWINTPKDYEKITRSLGANDFCTLTPDDICRCAGGDIHVCLECIEDSSH